MKKNGTLIILCVVFILIILAMYFVNKQLVSEIESDSENNKIIKTANIVKKSPKEVKNNKSVKYLEAAMKDEKISKFEKDFIGTEEPVYEPPLENVILMQ